MQSLSPTKQESGVRSQNIELPWRVCRVARAHPPFFLRYSREPMRSVWCFLLVSVAAAQGGFDAARLEAARDNLARKNTRALYIVKDGKVVLEWYADGVTAAVRQGEASLSKALVGGMSLLVAMSDGRIRPGDAASKFIPAWRGDEAKSKIQVRHLATHTSGIEDAEGDVAHTDLPGW